MNRRDFLQKSGMVAGAAGVISAAPLLAGQSAGASALKKGKAKGVTAPVARVSADDSGTPIVAHVRDLRAGVVEVFVGQRRITVNDKRLAARLAELAG
ncbi:MAG TPA: twin-arginine translocation signal domain-containing protein [Acidimicrobiales bacterium]|nr:twin-arginine translocation signal domain-containing protein [Acidimicrobiales bacterium]